MAIVAIEVEQEVIPELPNGGTSMTLSDPNPQFQGHL